MIEHRGVASIVGRVLAWLAAGLVAAGTAFAQSTPNAIESVTSQQQGVNTLVRILMRSAPAAAPGSFSVNNPPRVALDFAETVNKVGQNTVELAQGDVRSVAIVQAGSRARVVMNLKRALSYTTSIDGNAVVVALAPVAAGETSPQPAGFSRADTQASHALRDLDFRRGKDGEGRVVVELSDNGVGVDVRQQGQQLIVDFLRTRLPDNLRRRLDVGDFGTPVRQVRAFQQGDNTRLVIEPQGSWEHNAYQSDTQFVVEVKPVREDPNKLATRQGYRGDRLSLNFQNVDVRALLQVIADFTNLNIVTSDSVAGSLTLRLKDVPWDQALDIILQAKGLDMRKNGNVIWIAPRDELAAKEKLELESKIQISDLEPVRTESFQVNYHKAKTIYDFLKNKDQTVLSKRGTVIVDERSNKLFATDTPSRLDELRRLLSEIDVPVRQVLIEARIVEATDSFAKNLGSRLGIHDYRGADVGHRVLGNNSPRFNIGGRITDTGFHTQQTSTNPDFLKDAQSVNLPAAGIGTAQVGAFSLILFNSAKTQFLNLELSALELDGKGKIVSSPRVVTADQVEALIEQGTEIPYQQATSSGATSVAFRKASLSLKVKPQITPDGRIMMTLDINKDSPNTTLSTGSGVAIDTKHVKTDVLVENGGTVVIGGIYTQEERNTTTRIPLFGDLPYVGFLFRNNERVDNRSELLVFITPKIVSDTLSLR